MTDTILALDLGRIAQDLQIRKVQVESVVQLLDEGNTIPFITRYRKERTGGLAEDVIRQIDKRVRFQRQLQERKQTIIKSIQAQGKLTDELHQSILAAEHMRRLEDLYLPFKPKKKTLASAARERGLEPLALAVWGKAPEAADWLQRLDTFVNPEKELATPEAVKEGVQHIVAEIIAETAEVREAARRVLWETGKLATTKNETLPEGQGLEFKDYFQFTEPARHIPPHRILAINRGEKQHALKARIEHDPQRLEQAVLHRLPLADHPHAEFLKACAIDAIQRLILPSLEREIRRELTDFAEDHAVQVFSRNLRRLLLQPPIQGFRVLALDPGFRTGCKIAVLDEIGNLLEHSVVFPHGGGRREEKKHDKHDSKPAEAAAASVPIEAAPAGTGATETVAAAPAATATAEAPSAVEPIETPAAEAQAPAEAPAPSEASPRQSQAAAATKRAEAKAHLEEMVRKHGVHVVAIGNGTACRETEEVVSELILERLPELAYVIVNEAGASHYSASNVGREEFPDLDATVRGTISIGRRLQDPLSELVKIDPQNIGVGLYQHDLSEKRLKESLEAVIESCVNHVGVDLNTASVPLLRHVAGLNQLTARNLVDHRKQHGPFRNREQIREVTGVGDATFVQSAGFLKITGGDNPLDATWIHPEAYSATRWLMEQMNYPLEKLGQDGGLEEFCEKLQALPAEEVCKQLQIGVPTFHDIVETLSRPRRDPREDLPKPIFKKGVLKLEDLQSGMELRGTVLNVVDFGAFVDVGLKDSGLVHISQLANRYIKSPYDVVSVGDVVTVWVLNVDKDRHRVSLTMIQPGTERKQPERKPEQQGQARQERRGGQPQRGGRRPPQQQRQPAQQQGTGQETAEAGQAPAETAASRQTRRPPPRRQQQQQQRPRTYQSPRREPIQPKLSEEELQGDAPLHTFAELKAFFEAKKKQ